MKKILVGLLALTLTGCSSLMVSNLGESPRINTTAITVTDKRPPESKESKRDSVLSPLVVLGDENVQPPALLFLQSALQKHQIRTPRVELVVDEFYVIDFFPNRLKVATRQGGWLTDAFIESIIHSKTNWAFVNSAKIPQDSDSIVCLFSGAVNGKAIRVAAYSQYFASPMAISIRNDSEFTRAVKEAIDKTAKEVIKQIEN